MAMSVSVMLAAIVISWVAWKRCSYSRGVGFLEALRLLCIALVLVTLNQPELLEDVEPEQRPTLAILYDTSGSMQTRDVLDPAHPAERPRTRAESIQSLIEPEQWAAVRERMDVVSEAFSSTLPVPAEGTDLNGGLADVRNKYGNLRGVVLITDGDWNIGTAPVDAAARLRMKNIPVFGVGAGSETRLPDLELVSVSAPTFGVINKTIRIPFVIDSSLPRDVEVDVLLKSTDGKAVTKRIQIPARGRVEDTLASSPMPLAASMRRSTKAKPNSPCEFPCKTPNC